MIAAPPIPARLLCRTPGRTCTRDVRLARSLAVAAIVAACAVSRASAQAVSSADSAYLVALRTVLTDVRGDPPVGPLFLDSASAVVLDSAALRALAAAGVVPRTCRRVLQAVVGCGVGQRGLFLHVSRLKPLPDGHVSLTAMVRGRAAPGDRTVIVGHPYMASIELAPAGASWTIVRKDTAGGPRR